LDESKDTSKSTLDSLWGTEEETAKEENASKEAAPSEIKSEESAELTKSEEKDQPEIVSSGEEPKEAAPANAEKPKSDNTNSTLANSSEAAETLYSVSDASPDLTIAFLILLGLGISVFYNQSQQDQGAGQFNYKETNTLSARKGDEASLFFFMASRSKHWQ